MNKTKALIAIAVTIATGALAAPAHAKSTWTSITDTTLTAPDKSTWTSTDLNTIDPMKRW
jgi:hypothetical protein